VFKCYAISDLHRSLNEIIVLRGCSAAYIPYLTTDVSGQHAGSIFQGQSTYCLKLLLLTTENGTDSLSRNVIN